MRGCEDGYEYWEEWEYDRDHKNEHDQWNSRNAGETFREAMAREAFEEAGLRLAPDQLHLAHIMHRNSDSERVSLFFTTDAATGAPQNREPDKCAALLWQPRTALPETTIPYIRAALGYIAEGRNYSEFGW